MDKCKSLYIIDKAADFCEQKQILPPPQKKKGKLYSLPFYFNSVCNVYVLNAAKQVVLIDT